MKKLHINGLALWQFESLGQEDAIQHFVSDRSSHSPEKEFTLSFSSSPDKAFIQENRSLLAVAIGIEQDRCYLPSEIPKTRIANVTGSTAKYEPLETDDLTPHIPGVCIAVMSADCIPILLYDRKNNA